MSTIGAIEALWVSRASGLWFFPKREPFGVLSSDKSVKRLATGGTRLGPWSPMAGVTRSMVSIVSAATGVGRVSRTWVRGPRGSTHEHNGPGP